MYLWSRITICLVTPKQLIFTSFAWQEILYLFLAIWKKLLYAQHFARNIFFYHVFRVSTLMEISWKFVSNVEYLQNVNIVPEIVNKILGIFFGYYVYNAWVLNYMLVNQFHLKHISTISPNSRNFIFTVF